MQPSPWTSAEDAQDSEGANPIALVGLPRVSLLGGAEGPGSLVTVPCVLGSEYCTPGVSRLLLGVNASLQGAVGPVDLSTVAERARAHSHYSLRRYNLQHFG